MPYIRVADRIRLLKSFTIKESDAKELTSGELNFLITTLLIKHLGSWDYNYEDLNRVIGVLEAVKSEFYRRTVTPYEDEKIKENTDVY